MEKVSCKYSESLDMFDVDDLSLFLGPQTCKIPVERVVGCNHMTVSDPQLDSHSSVVLNNIRTKCKVPACNTYGSCIRPFPWHDD